MNPVPVIILNWNGWEDTLRCLRSLRDAADVTEVWLVDNASDVDRSEEARGEYPGLRILQWDDNYGWAGGNNRALRIAADEGCEFAYLLNNDCQVAPGFLKAAVAAIIKDATIAAVGSLIESAIPHGYAQFDGQYHGPGDRLVESGGGVFPARYFSGAGVLLRVSALSQVGFFDERLFCYGEEMELSLRLAKNEWKVAVCWDSRVKHLGAGSDVSENMLYYTTRNRFLWVHLADGDRRRKAYRNAIHTAVAGAHATLRSNDLGKWLAIASGLRDGIRGDFGKRKDQPLDPVFRAKLLWWTFGTILYDKWRSLRGQPPTVVRPESHWV